MTDNKEEERKYVSLRNMQESDLPFGLSLSRLAKWNQRHEDWQMYFNASKGKSYIALFKEKEAGTVTTINYDELFSWIGMVLVNPKIRRSGLGTALLHKALEACEGHGAIALDATPEGRKLYQTLGFHDDCNLTRLTITDTNTLPTNYLSKRICSKIEEDDLDKVIEFDAHYFGANRNNVLKHLYQHNKDFAFFMKTNNHISGYCLGRAGYNYDQIGPIIAHDFKTAKSLLIQVLVSVRQGDPNRPLLIDAFDKQNAFIELLNKLGFQEERKFIRMFKGPKPDCISMKQQFAICGPELG